MLPEAPTHPIEDGTPDFGTYAGRCRDTDLRLAQRGVGRLRRAISEKRWQWFGAFDERIAIGGAIVDAGPFGNAFLWVFDRESEELLVDADLLVPARFVTVATEPADGVVARVDLPRRRLRVTRAGDGVAIDGRFGGVDLTLAVDASDHEATTAICPVTDRNAGVNVTQKETCLPTQGHVDADERLAFDGVAMLDYSHGHLARETNWRWAIGSCRTDDGVAVGFNLVEGFNDGLENAVWVAGEPRPVDAASFAFETDGTDGNCHVETTCGTVDATLVIEGQRREDIDIGVVASKYHQPLGHWKGTVAGRRIEGVGVTERHHAKW